MEFDWVSFKEEAPEEEEKGCRYSKPVLVKCHKEKHQLEEYFVGRYYHNLNMFSCLLKSPDRVVTHWCYINPPN
jgi:hypothetical protein